jgi:hypothetical protein
LGAPGLVAHESPFVFAHGVRGRDPADQDSMGQHGTDLDSASQASIMCADGEYIAWFCAAINVALLIINGRNSWRFSRRLSEMKAEHIHAIDEAASIRAQACRERDNWKFAKMLSDAENKLPQSN